MYLFVHWCSLSFDLIVYCIRLVSLLTNLLLVTNLWLWSHVVSRLSTVLAAYNDANGPRFIECFQFILLALSAKTGVTYNCDSYWLEGIKQVPLHFCQAALTSSQTIEVMKYDNICPYRCQDFPEAFSCCEYWPADQPPWCSHLWLYVGESFWAWGAWTSPARLASGFETFREQLSMACWFRRHRSTKHWSESKRHFLSAVTPEAQSEGVEGGWRWWKMIKATSYQGILDQDHTWQWRPSC